MDDCEVDNDGCRPGKRVQKVVEIVEDAGRNRKLFLIGVSSVTVHCRRDENPRKLQIAGGQSELYVAEEGCFQEGKKHDHAHAFDLPQTLVVHDEQAIEATH